MKKIFSFMLAAVAVFACDKPVEEQPGDNKKAELEVVAEANYDRPALNAEEISFEILAKNTSWTVTVDKDWCTAEPATGKADAEVVITVADNETPEARKATVTVKAEGVEKAETFTISQAAKGALTVTEAVPAGNIVTEGGSKTFTVQSNMAWTATSDSDWLTLDKTSGQPSAEAVTVTATAAANTGAARAAKVTVVARTEQKVIEIKQDMYVVEVKLKFAPISDELKSTPLNYKGQDVVFEIEGDATAADWEVVVSTPFAETYGTVEKGTNNATVKFPSSQFVCPGPVTVTLLTNGEKSDEVTLTQDSWWMPNQGKGSTIVLNNDGSVNIVAGGDPASGNTIMTMKEGIRFANLVFNLEEVNLTNAQITLESWTGCQIQCHVGIDNRHYVSMNGAAWHDWSKFENMPALADITQIKFCLKPLAGGALPSEVWINGNMVANYSQWMNSQDHLWNNTFKFDFGILSKGGVAEGNIKVKSVNVEVL